ncbi:hypothetical protein HYX02_02935 [Candidatus Woesearchaeota archaeon]|nr:hypothetical protein [Candidatus Woesearchaeota archaeon]
MAKKLSEVQLRNVIDEERELFNQIQDKLGFKKEAEFYGLCAAIGMSHHLKNRNENLSRLYNGKTAWHSTSINGINTFEYLLDLRYPQQEDNQRNLFEDLFYTGFLIVSKWWETRGQDCRNELERFIDLLNFIEQPED